MTLQLSSHPSSSSSVELLGIRSSANTASSPYIHINKRSPKRLKVEGEEEQSQSHDPTIPRKTQDSPKTTMTPPSPQDHMPPFPVPMITDGADSRAQVMGSPDLMVEILQFVTDGSPKTLDKVSKVSKVFHSAAMNSEKVWKETCRQRWSSKWGFTQRWKTAQEQAERFAQDPSNKGKCFWKNKYRWEEADAKRETITAEELSNLTFDYRFWVDWIDIPTDEQGVRRSGLRHPASITYQFGAAGTLPNVPQANLQQQAPARGRVVNHPSGNDDLEWFLDADGRGLQWGQPPMFLWPKARIKRLDTWGWEVHNPNVCLRAVDDRGSSEELWHDYLSSLVYVQAQLGQFQGLVEVPERFTSIINSLSGMSL